MLEMKSWRSEVVHFVPHEIFELAAWQRTTADQRALWLGVLCGPCAVPVPGVAVADSRRLASSLHWEELHFEQLMSELVQAGVLLWDRLATVAYCPLAIECMPASVAARIDREWLLLGMRHIPDSDLRDRIRADVSRRFDLDPEVM